MLAATAGGAVRRARRRWCPIGGRTGATVGMRVLRATVVAGTMAIAADGLDRPRPEPARRSAGRLRARLPRVRARRGDPVRGDPRAPWAARLTDAVPETTLPLVTAIGPGGLRDRGPRLGRRVDRAAGASTSASVRVVVLAVAIASIVLASVAAFIQDDIEHIVGYAIVGDAGRRDARGRRAGSRRPGRRPGPGSSRSSSPAARSRRGRRRRGRRSAPGRVGGAARLGDPLARPRRRARSRRRRQHRSAGARRVRGARPARSRSPSRVRSRRSCPARDAVARSPTTAACFAVGIEPARAAIERRRLAPSLRPHRSDQSSVSRSARAWADNRNVTATAGAAVLAILALACPPGRSAGHRRPRGCRRRSARASNRSRRASRRPRLTSDAPTVEPSPGDGVERAPSLEPPGLSPEPSLERAPDDLAD